MYIEEAKDEKAGLGTLCGGIAYIYPVFPVGLGHGRCVGDGAGRSRADRGESVPRRTVSQIYRGGTGSRPGRMAFPERAGAGGGPAFKRAGDQFTGRAGVFSRPALSGLRKRSSHGAGPQRKPAHRIRPVPGQSAVPDRCPGSAGAKRDIL